MKLQIDKLVKGGLYKEALELYTRLHSASSPPTKYTFPYILKACAQLKYLSHGQMLHAHLFKSGHQTSRHTTTDLTNMYMKLNAVDSAAKLFDEIPHPSVSVLNVVISGFLQNGLLEEGFRVFRSFSVFNLRIDSVTVASIASACGNLVNCFEVHCLAVKIGVDMEEYAATSLLTMYMNCGELASATRLFGWIEDKNLVCYNAYLSGLEQNGAVEIVFHVLKEMLRSLREKPDIVTVIAVSSASAKGRNLRFGKQLHGSIAKVPLMLHTNIGTALVDMYSKCGSWECAYSVFTEMGSNRTLITWNSMIAGMMLNDQSENAITLFTELERQEGLEADSATWNSMISGFSQLGRANEAFLFFRKMLSCGVIPSMRCITSLLAACSSQSMLRYGKEVHAHITRIKIIVDEFLATTIIDMYMKCGRPSLAYNVFSRFNLRHNDPAPWNAMISGYGRNGKIEDAFDIFSQMVEENVKPNAVTFGCLLSVCRHTGEVNKAFQILRLMALGYGLDPSSEHLNILIDLLSRSGKLDEALALLQVTHETSPSVYASFLGACKDYLNSKLGEEMAQRLAEMEPLNPLPFVILSNIYAGQEKWEDVHTLREIMDKQELRKLAGHSLIQVT